MGILKIKDWIKNKKAAFEFVSIIDDGGAQRVRRLSDGLKFDRFILYSSILDGSIIDICAFNKDLVHVIIRLYDENKNYLTSRVVHINSLRVRRLRGQVQYSETNDTEV